MIAPGGSAGIAEWRGLHLHQSFDPQHVFGAPAHAEWVAATKVTDVVMAIVLVKCHCLLRAFIDTSHAGDAQIVIEFYNFADLQVREAQCLGGTDADAHLFPQAFTKVANVCIDLQELACPLKPDGRNSWLKSASKAIGAHILADAAVDAAIGVKGDQAPTSASFSRHRSA